MQVAERQEEASQSNVVHAGVIGMQDADGAALRNLALSDGCVMILADAVFSPLRMLRRPSKPSFVLLLRTAGSRRRPPRRTASTCRRRPGKVVAVRRDRQQDLDTGSAGPSVATCTPGTPGSRPR